jgi:hypothetical protein
MRVQMLDTTFYSARQRCAIYIIRGGKTASSWNARQYANPEDALKSPQPWLTDPTSQPLGEQ